MARKPIIQKINIVTFALNVIEFEILISTLKFISNITSFLYLPSPTPASML